MFRTPDTLQPPRTSDMRSMKERRVDTRLLCAELVEMIWEDQLGRPRRRVANLEDISSCGACLQLESPVVCGTPISMRYANGLFAGTVRYCVYQDMGYFLGIQFESGSRWSPNHFQPGHLVDLQQLAEAAARRWPSGSETQN